MFIAVRGPCGWNPNESLRRAQGNTRLLNGMRERGFERRARALFGNAIGDDVAGGEAEILRIA
jgi:hypothetical protein